MTGERESTLNTFSWLMRRNALADIFENVEDREKFRFFALLGIETNSNGDCEVSDEKLDEFESEDLKQSVGYTRPALLQSSENLPNRNTTGCSETTTVLSLRISQEERLGGSSLPLCRDARPSCLINICTAATSSTSTCQFISSSTNLDSPNLSPSAEMLTINFPDDSPSDLLPSDPNLPEWITMSHTRRNALHNLLETLTEEDCEKLKSLYQSTLANASYSFNSSFSDLTQGPMRNFHECTA